MFCKHFKSQITHERQLPSTTTFYKQRSIDKVASISYQFFYKQEKLPTSLQVWFSKHHEQHNKVAALQLKCHEMKRLVTTNTKAYYSLQVKQSSWAAHTNGLHLVSVELKVSIKQLLTSKLPVGTVSS